MGVGREGLDEGVGAEASAADAPAPSDPTRPPTHAPAAPHRNPAHPRLNSCPECRSGTDAIGPA
jgi:hypothetical protein